MAAPAKKKGLAAPSKRLEAIPPYMFAELERRIADEARRGNRRDQPRDRRPRHARPTRYVVEAMQEAVADPATQKYPSNRGRAGVPRGVRRLLRLQRFGVEIDPETEVIPAIGAKECIYNLCFAFLDPGDVALASDPGYPVYTGGPILAGAEAELLPLRARARLRARTSTRSRPRTLEAARLIFLNYPNNPTGAVVPEGFFERVVELRPRARDPRRPRQRLLGDDLRRLRRAELPGDAGGEGGRRRGLLALQGLQHDRLALRRDPRQRRGDQDLLAPEDERRLGPVRGRPARRRRRAARPAQGARGDERGSTRAAATWWSTRCARSGSRSSAPKGTIYVWAPVPEGHTSDLVRRARARGGRRSSSRRARCTDRAARASSGSR